jgi:hypothetical protein
MLLLVYEKRKDSRVEKYEGKGIWDKGEQETEEQRNGRRGGEVTVLV